MLEEDISANKQSEKSD